MGIGAVFHWELGQKCVINPDEKFAAGIAGESASFQVCSPARKRNRVSDSCENGPNVFEGDPREGTGPALSCHKAVRIKLGTKVPPLPVTRAASMMLL